MPARVAMRSMLRSEYEAPSASRASVAARTAAWIAARLAVGAGSSRDSTDAIAVSLPGRRPVHRSLTLCQVSARIHAMASLLDLTTQGDVATIADETKLAHLQLMSPRQLYELWERQGWASHEIDFTQDRRDWEALSEVDRDEASWGLANFFVGEERVATQFSGLVMAYEDQHEEAFLTTQQVDEARHAQHFNRLYENVLQYDGSFEDRLARCRQQLNEHYITLFDEHLVNANRALIDNPRDIEAKIDFVVIYHMVIEGTLALTGQYFQTA